MIRSSCRMVPRMSFLRAAALGTTLLAIACIASPARAADCVRLTCPASSATPDACELPATALRARLPSGLRLAAVRGGTAVSARRASTFEACAPVGWLTAPVALDAGALHGAVRIAGAFRSAGVVRYAPGNGFALAFLPQPAALRRGGRFFRASFEVIGLDDAVPLARIRVPPRLAGATCWQAQGTLEARDFDVLVGPSEEAGAHARVARLTGLHAFEACTAP